MNTTNVPAEWFRELIEINNKIIEASTKPVNERDWSFYIGCLQSHIYNYKYFNQPEQSSELEELEMEEFGKWIQSNNKYTFHVGMDKWVVLIDSIYNTIPFSEVYKAFLNREK